MNTNDMPGTSNTTKNIGTAMVMKRDASIDIQNGSILRLDSDHNDRDFVFVVGFQDNYKGHPIAWLGYELDNASKSLIQGEIGGAIIIAKHNLHSIVAIHNRGHVHSWNDNDRQILLDTCGVNTHDLI